MGSSPTINKEKFGATLVVTNESITLMRIVDGVRLI